MKITIIIFLMCLYAFGQSAAKDKEFSDVTITQSNEDDPSAFANLLLDKLVEKSILDEAIASKILATFKVNGVNRNPQAAQAFTTATIGTLAIKGNADASKKFIHRLTKVLDQTDQQGLHLIEKLLELVLNNDLMAEKDGAELAAANGYGVKIETTRYSSDNFEMTPAPTRKGCCAKSLSSLVEFGTEAWKPWKYYLADFRRVYGFPVIVRNHVGLVALGPESCACDGIKLEPIYMTFKAAFPGASYNDHNYSNFTEATKLAQAGSNNYGVYFYCAKVQGQCGATEPLRKYYLTADKAHFLTTSLEEGKKAVAAGAKDEGVLCYVWPNPPALY